MNEVLKRRQCVARVSSPQARVLGKRQCERQGKFFHGLKWYCTQHHPVNVKKRQAEAYAKHAPRPIAPQWKLADKFGLQRERATPDGAPTDPGTTLYTFDHRGMWVYELPPLPEK